MEIQERIFDFDNWNSFAIAEYFPFLTADTFTARLSQGVKYRPILDLSKPLGGRITGKFTSCDAGYNIQVIVMKSNEGKSE